MEDLNPRKRKTFEMGFEREREAENKYVGAGKRRRELAGGIMVMERGEKIQNHRQEKKKK
jgi:hypothetical protein